jgi:hypothetical protein
MLSVPFHPADAAASGGAANKVLGALEDGTDRALGCCPDGWRLDRTSCSDSCRARSAGEAELDMSVFKVLLNGLMLEDPDAKGFDRAFLGMFGRKSSSRDELNDRARSGLAVAPGDSAALLMIL